MLFGLFPALQASRPDLNETLKEGGRSGGGAGGRQRVRGALVIVEVALSVALLNRRRVTAAKFLQAARRQTRVRAGELADYADQPPAQSLSRGSRSWAFYTRLLRKTKALPGVQDAALTSSVPLSGLGSTSSEVQIPGQAAAPDGSQPSAGLAGCQSGLFAHARHPTARARF